MRYADLFDDTRQQNLGQYQPFRDISWKTIDVVGLVREFDLTGEEATKVVAERDAGRITSWHDMIEAIQMVMLPRQRRQADFARNIKARMQQIRKSLR